MAQNGQGKIPVMSRYTIRIERVKEECREGRCGHLHEIPVVLGQSQIVCSDLSCRETDASLVRKIFVPYDGSRFSNRAFEFALDLAKKYGSSITVGTVMAGSSFEDTSPESLDTSARIVDRERLAALEVDFGKMGALSKKFSIPVRTEVIISSSAAESLVAYANSNKVDLIVMGTRGRGDNRLMLGSISIAVSQKALAPVLLVK